MAVTASQAQPSAVGSRSTDDNDRDSSCPAIRARHIDSEAFHPADLSMEPQVSAPRCRVHISDTYEHEQAEYNDPQAISRGQLTGACYREPPLAGLVGGIANEPERDRPFGALNRSLKTFV